jgi:uncharacterized repeat protein (TIGR02543 family)
MKKTLLLLMIIFLIGCTDKNKEIIITFESNGGTLISDMTLDGLLTAGLPIPEKEGFIFNGWYFDQAFNDKIEDTFSFESSLTLYAKWTEEIQTVIVTFETNDGTLINPITLNSGALMTLPTPPTKEGYLFIGWFLDSNLTVSVSLDTPVNQNQTWYAKWEETSVVTYLITFETLGGSLIAAAEVVSGMSIGTPEVPVKNGYQFIGWYLDEDYSNEIDIDTPIFEDQVWYAKWQFDGIYITFDSMGGTDVVTLLGIAGDPLDKPEDPSKEGFVFAGWFLDIMDTEIFTFDVFPQESITLYADWGTEGLFFQLMDDELSYEVGAGDAIDESSIVIPKYYLGLPVTRIMPDGFMVAENMNVIVLPETLIEISNHSFFYATSLTEIYIPRNVEKIGSVAFRYCYSLSSFIVSEDNPYYASLDGVIFNKDLSILVRYPQNKEGTTYTVPNVVDTIWEDAFSDADNLITIDLGIGVKTIKTHAFYHMSSLESIVIPDQVTTLELYAFRECSALISVTLGSGLTQIDAYVFNECVSLETIVIPFNITFIGYGAFYYCNSLSKIYITRTSLNGIIQGSLFMLAYTPSNLIIYLPDQQTLNDYKLADFWKSYASKMEIGQYE